MSQIEEALYPVFIKDKGTRGELCACLKYKKIHPHGRRACGRGLAKFQLKVGGRLQAVGQIKTIRDLDSVEPPVTVYFLRPSTSSAIANVPIIINIPDVNDDGIEWFRLEYFVDCVLHTIDIGILCHWHGESLVALLRADAFDVEATNQEERIGKGSSNCVDARSCITVSSVW